MDGARNVLTARAEGQAESLADRSDLLVIVADDPGCVDLGSYGSDLHAPPPRSWPTPGLISPVDTRPRRG